jgi:flagellar hook assembly protein FlgD
VFSQDAGGNTAVYQVEFSVDTKLRLHNVFNYPNPFTHSTQFTYNLTQIADEVKIKIFTVAGRLVRDIGYAPGFTGFNTVSWDGTDENGDKLANGTYFYRLIARSGSEQVSVTNKVSIIR